MLIKIKRSFERTRQIADFVPIKAYCEVTQELETSADDMESFMSQQSASLDSFVQSEVEKTLMSYRPICISCGGKGEKIILNKEGVCGQCHNRHQMEARDFRNSNEKNGTPESGTKGQKTK